MSAGLVIVIVVISVELISVEVLLIGLGLGVVRGSALGSNSSVLPMRAAGLYVCQAGSSECRCGLGLGVRSKVAKSAWKFDAFKGSARGPTRALLD